MKEYEGAKKKIRKAMIDNEVSATDIAEYLGMKNPNSFYTTLNRNTMSYTKVEEIADFLGCDVVFIDRKTGRIY